MNTYAIEYVCKRCNQVTTVVAVGESDISESVLSAIRFCAGCGHDKRDLLGCVNISQYAQSKAEEIASLQEAAAEKDSVIEAQSEELGTARKFIEAFAAENLPEDERLALMIFHSWYQAAKKQAAQWQAAEVETADNPKPLDTSKVEETKLYAIPKRLKRVLTRNNETMATFYMDSDEVVAFPKTWQEYGDKISENWAMNRHITIIAKLDMSKDTPYYIMTGIEGVEPHVPEAAQAQSAEGE